MEPEDRFQWNEGASGGGLWLKPTGTQKGRASEER